MIFSLEVVRARKGDCLLLHAGSKASPRLLLIDAGPSEVYSNHLRPRLLDLKKARGLEDTDPLPIDLLMVSHVDDDHIRGVLDLTGEVRANANRPIVEIRKAWHNSFDALVDGQAQPLTAAFTAAFGAASLDGGVPDDADIGSDEPEEVVADSLRVLASIPQGVRLNADLRGLSQINPEFEGRIAVAGKKAHKVEKDLEFLVAGPLQPELDALREDHRKWLVEQKKKKRDAPSALAAYVDESVSNLSSIVVLAKSGGKTMLLTGDARGDRILAGLEEVGALKTGKALHVDLLKVPHHGSSNNVERKFFERITADHYVMSGDGEHGNPERETFEMLFAARGTAPFTVYLTYPLEELDKGRKLDWKKEQAKEKKRFESGGKKKPRKNWSDATNALVSFFEKQKLAPGQRLVFVEPRKPSGGQQAREKPCVIDLLDPFAG